MNFVEQSFLILISTISVLSLLFSILAWRSAGANRSEDQTRTLADLKSAVDSLPRLFREDAGLTRGEASNEAVRLREEIGKQVQSLREGLEGSFKSLGETTNQRLDKFGETAAESALALSRSQTERLENLTTAMKDLSERLEKQQKEANALIGEGLEKLRVTLAESLDALRKDNEAKLEKMRETVEEKLQGTLETRLGESFKQVSDRLEQVHKGLGEMQTLATGVGDLKRVLTNVKSRGGWGEVQLGALLEEVLTADQFQAQCAIKPGRERVDFAVRLPGQTEDTPLWLPIDAKFPQEDYDRLLLAQEAGDASAAELASISLERAVRAQAKKIGDQYIEPPQSTDFAILYLPTEGLYAEVARRAGLLRDLQSNYRIMVAGPSNLYAFLTSLQMGFRTLAIQKRSSEVWQVLAAAKNEFEKYGQVWEKLSKQLDTAKNTVEEAGKRTRAVTRRLRDVQVIDQPPKLIALVGGLAEDIVGDDDD